MRMVNTNFEMPLLQKSPPKSNFVGDGIACRERPAGGLLHCLGRINGFGPRGPLDGKRVVAEAFGIYLG